MMKKLLWCFFIGMMVLGCDEKGLRPFVELAPEETRNDLRVEVQGGLKSLTLSVTQAPTGIEEYRVRLYEGSSCDGRPLASIPLRVRSDNVYLIEGLGSNTLYSVTITGISGGMSSVVSECLSATTAKSEVGDVPLPLVEKRGTSLVVSWEEPETGGEDIIGYTVYRYENATCSGTAVETMAEGTTYMTSALSPGSEVSFRVSATDSVGEGDPSGCVSGEIEAVVPDVPTSVTTKSSRLVCYCELATSFV